MFCVQSSTHGGLSVSDNRSVVELYRQRAAILRLKLTTAIGASARKQLIQLAEEHEWRAACLEASVAVIEREHLEPATLQNRSETA